MEKMIESLIEEVQLLQAEMVVLNVLTRAGLAANPRALGFLEQAVTVTDDMTLNLPFTERQRELVRTWLDDVVQRLRSDVHKEAAAAEEALMLRK